MDECGASVGFALDSYPPFDAPPGEDLTSFVGTSFQGSRSEPAFADALHMSAWAFC